MEELLDQYDAERELQRRRNLEFKDPDTFGSQIAGILRSFDSHRRIGPLWNQAVDQINQWFGSGIQDCSVSHPYTQIDLLSGGPGGGEDVRIYNTCRRDDLTDCQYITKEANWFEQWIDGIREVLIGYVAGLSGIGPVVYDAYFCYRGDQVYLYIVQEKAKGLLLGEWFLSTYAKTYDEYKIYPELCQVLREMIEKMHKLGIVHGDLHGGNIFIQTNPLGATFIDYGKSRTWPDIRNKIYQDDASLTAFMNAHGRQRYPTPSSVLEQNAVDEWQFLGGLDYRSIQGPKSYGLCDRISEYRYEIIRKNIWF